MSSTPFKDNRYHLTKDQLALLGIFQPLRPVRRRRAKSAVNPKTIPSLQSQSKETRRKNPTANAKKKKSPERHAQSVIMGPSARQRVLVGEPNKVVERYKSAFPIRLNMDDITVRLDNTHQIPYDGPVIPRELSMITMDTETHCSCQIMMRYQGETIGSHVSSSRRDEVTIIQEVKIRTNAIVFKGFLKAGDRFAFKSQRAYNMPFRLRIEINDLCYALISSCCESKYQAGHTIDENNHSFLIENIDGIQPCLKCRGESSTILYQNKPPMCDRSTSTQMLYRSETASKMLIFERTVELPTSLVQFNEAPGIDAESDQRSPSTLSLDEEPTAALEFQAMTSSSPSEESSSLSSSEKFDQTSIERKSKSASPQPSNDLVLTRTESFKPVSAKSAPSLPKSIPDRVLGHVENFILVWIGEEMDEELRSLRSFINIIRLLESTDKLEEFFQENFKEKLIFIIPFIPPSTVIAMIDQSISVHEIYLITQETYPSTWKEQYQKIIGTFSTVVDICSHLESVFTTSLDTRIIPVIIAPKDSTTDDAFTYAQLLKETLLCKDDESDLTKDMLQFCRTHYSDNPVVMIQIDEYEKHSTDVRAIWWCTRTCFISRMLARALRTQEIDLVFKMRHAIQTLHEQIISTSMKRTTTVYSILELDITVAQSLTENIGGLVIFGGFLPATLKKQESLPICRSKERTMVQFTIQVAANCATSIEELRSNDSTDDILIDLNTVFRIISVDEQQETSMTIRLATVPLTDSHFNKLTNQARKDMQAPVVILQIIKLLLATDHYAEGDYLTELIYRDQSFQGDSTLLASLAAAHHLLGNVNDERGEYEAARNQFQKSLRAFHLFLPPNHHLMSSSYNNIGSMYFKDDQYKEAIEYHQKALQCQLISPSPDLDSIATYTTNIGAVYFAQKNYSEALKHLRRAEEIFERMMGKDKVENLLTIYQKIAACYWRTNNAREALGYYQKTLDLQQNSASYDRHSISVTYFNLSTAYARLGQMDEAVNCAEKSIEELKKIFPPDHPEIKENQAQLEIVKQKQWLQEVLADNP